MFRTNKKWLFLISIHNICRLCFLSQSNWRLRWVQTKIRSKRSWLCHDGGQVNDDTNPGSHGVCVYTIKQGPSLRLHTQVYTIFTYGNSVQRGSFTQLLENENRIKIASEKHSPRCDCGECVLPHSKQPDLWVHPGMATTSTEKRKQKIK